MQFTGKRELTSCKSLRPFECSFQLPKGLRNQQEGQAGLKKWRAKRREPHQSKTQSCIELF